MRLLGRSSSLLIIQLTQVTPCPHRRYRKLLHLFKIRINLFLISVRSEFSAFLHCFLSVFPLTTSRPKIFPRDDEVKDFKRLTASYRIVPCYIPAFHLSTRRTTARRRCKNYDDEDEQRSRHDEDRWGRHRTVRYGSLKRCVPSLLSVVASEEERRRKRQKSSRYRTKTQRAQKRKQKKMSFTIIIIITAYVFHYKKVCTIS
ncbi:uncharacterized protein J3D65DRAFT_116267 [Phyllosticta citribraziliensis]|uniref:Transmembrane protein n=1 Tax=Phyllosticta citribraziliensis TaxID=989973 RepID=A0ABR1LAM2_9PEZI